MYTEEFHVSWKMGINIVCKKPFNANTYEVYII